MHPLRIAVLVKQIPKVEAMVLGDDGRLVREGLPLEMNAYCRRAVAIGAELAAATGGTVTALTLGPPSAEDTLREAIAWIEERGVPVEGVHLCDPAFAGSDTLVTAQALAAALQRHEAFDLVLAGRNSVDADTGQVGPELAQLLDLAFVAGVRELALVDGAVSVRLEHDDEWVEATVSLPAVLSVAERLTDPAKVPPEGRAAVASDRITSVTAAELGPGPWGAAASPTSVGDVRSLEVERLRRRLAGSVEDQVAEAVAVLADRGVLEGAADGPSETVAPPAGAGGPAGPAVAVVVEPDRVRLTRELLGAAARLASELGGRVVALGTNLPPVEDLGTWGVDEAVTVTGALVEEDVAAGVAEWVAARGPWAVLAPSTAWGREVASRVAAALGAGLTGDAVGLTIEDEPASEPEGAGAGTGGRLVAWKPAFGGLLVAAVRSTSPVQLVTVRAGVLPLLEGREPVPVATGTVGVTPRGRVVVHGRHREDDAEALASADVVIGIGQGIDPAHYAELEPLRRALGAELAATRKVTDKGWLPRARQLGITGHSIAPRLYVALGLSGKFNHTMGVRSSGTILAVNPDPEALIFEWADLAIVGDWREVAPLLVERLEEAARDGAAGTEH
ncbi:MAG: FAD-binding protein [Acidimicrobiales bacterium]|nr:FAD-binding protein [Acidimicrobiales bacterium]